MLSVVVLLLMMAAIFWPAYRVTHPVIASPRRADGAHRGSALPVPEEPAMLGGRRLDDYVAQGLVDLRIMLVQAARRPRG